MDYILLDEATWRFMPVVFTDGLQLKRALAVGSSMARWLDL